MSEQVMVSRFCSRLQVCRGQWGMETSIPTYPSPTTHRMSAWSFMVCFHSVNLFLLCLLNVAQVELSSMYSCLFVRGQWDIGFHWGISLAERRNRETEKVLLYRTHRCPLYCICRLWLGNLTQADKGRLDGLVRVAGCVIGGEPSTV